MGWRRIGGLAHLLFGTLMIVGFGFLFCGFVVGAVLAHWPVWMVLVQVCLLAAVGGLVRMLMVGLFVSDQGVKIRSATSTVSFDWSEVLSVRSEKATLTNGKLPMISITARQITFDLTNGQTINAPVHGMLRGEHRHVRLPTVLSATDYDQTMADLRHLVSVHQPNGPAPAPAVPSFDPPQDSLPSQLGRSGTIGAPD